MLLPQREGQTAGGYKDFSSSVSCECLLTPLKSVVSSLRIKFWKSRSGLKNIYIICKHKLRRQHVRNSFKSTHRHFNKSNN